METIITIKSKFLRNIFDQNTYVISNKKEAVIIDAGAEVEDIMQVVQGKKVLGVLITHLHFDHIWNIDKYLDTFNCDVFIQTGHDDKFKNSEKNASTSMRLKISKEIAQNKIKYYAKKLKLGSFEFEIFETPGHSADSVCLLLNGNLFSGDTVFVDGIGRTDLYDSDNKQMADSLKIIRQINYNNLYSGHYEVSTKQKTDELIDRYL